MTLKSRYERVMEHIEVTDEMERRILQHIRQAEENGSGAGEGAHAPAPRRTASPLRRFLPLAACLALAVTALAALLPGLPDEEGPPVLAATAVVDCSSADKLSEVVHFTVADLEGLPFQVERSAYTAYQEVLAEITYSGEDQTAVFRKSPGSGDISGSYEDFASVSEVSVAPYTVTLKGEEGGYQLALWSDGEFAYSLQFSSGFPERDWVELLGSIAAP